MVFAFSAAVSLFVVSTVDPYSGATASQRVPSTLAAADARFGGDAIQAIDVRSNYTVEIQHEAYIAATPEPEPAPAAAGAAGWAPPSVVPDPGSAQAYAASAVAARGWANAEFDCLVALWNKESGWRVNAMNPSSGAYGIPQALPGAKMASAGADWSTSAATQIEWGLGYVQNRYGTPCGAWGHSQSVGWY